MRCPVELSGGGGGNLWSTTSKATPRAERHGVGGPGRESMVPARRASPRMRSARETCALSKRRNSLGGRTAKRKRLQKKPCEKWITSFLMEGNGRKAGEACHLAMETATHADARPLLNQPSKDMTWITTFLMDGNGREAGEPCHLAMETATRADRRCPSIT